MENHDVEEKSRTEKMYRHFILYKIFLRTTKSLDFQLFSSTADMRRKSSEVRIKY